MCNRNGFFSKFLLKLKHSNKKDLLILIYANGNNDLEPEVYEAIRKIKEIEIQDNIYLVLQLARAPIGIVQKLRLQNSKPTNEKWDGVRRYKISRAGVELIHDLGKVNIADPKTLLDFLLWATQTYPCERILLILSGHGAGFAGVMPDFTTSYPQIMTLKGLINAFKQFRIIEGRCIDYLLFDQCYMNMLEIWYEFAKTAKEAIKYLIVADKNIHISGLPLDLIIQKVQELNHKKLRNDAFLVNLINLIDNSTGIDNKLIGVRLKDSYFLKLQKALDMIIGNLLKQNAIYLKKQICTINNNFEPPFLQLLRLNKTFINESCYDKKNWTVVKKLLKKILILPPNYSKDSLGELNSKLYFPTSYTQFVSLHKYYSKLEFTKKSLWNALLNKVLSESSSIPLVEEQDDFEPECIPMPIGSIAAVIKTQNPQLTQAQLGQIINELGWNKELINQLNK